MEKIVSIQSHLSSELLFTCGIWGFACAELSHSHKRRGIVGFNCTHRQTHAYSKAAAVIALRVITASQRHGFPLTVLCGRQELNCLSPVSCASLLPQSELFFSRLLNHHPLKSRASASSPAAHRLPVHGPIAEAIKLLTTSSLLLLPPPPPLKSSPLLTSSSPNSFLLPLLTPPPTLSSLSAPQLGCLVDCKTRCLGEISDANVA